jgi:Squalene-hopene cyclase C-terminal domain
MSQSANQARAGAFVQAHGSASEQSRLRVLLDGTRPTAEEEAAILAGQRPDGGWAPFWAADYSSVDATCFRLAQAEQGGIASEHEAIQRAVRFLRDRQQVDGSWEEAAAVADAEPPWAMPGDLAARLYLTANSSYWLAKHLPHDTAAIRGAAVLRAHLDESGQMPTFLHAHWLVAGAWYCLGQHDLAERVLASLPDRLDETTPASSLSWLITCLRTVDVPADHPAILKALTLLEAGQRADGGWTSEDGPAAAAHTTLEALRAFFLCRDL